MQARGPISFEEFMRDALYDPRRGYYARRITGVGVRGDFTTAPMMSGVLARAIASWAAAAMTECGCRDLVEIGPGDGTLAAAVLGHLPWRRRWRTRLHLVETSEPLAALQRRRLGRRARWHGSPAAAMAACGGRAVVFSNELVDAFPVRRFELTESGWREMGVAFDGDGGPVEVLRSPAPLPDSSVFDGAHRTGQRVEVHETYHRWLHGWLPEWRAGRLLTIDYGAEVGGLYHRRPQGSLRAYFMQQRLEGAAVYQNPGRQDLTADVNFTDLIRWSDPWTGDAVLVPLAVFLTGHADASHPADRALVDPDGAGGAFRVLDQKCRPRR